MRGATWLVKWHRHGRYFNPRSSCEERLPCDRHRYTQAAISIHAPHARSDGVVGLIGGFVDISIHAPHARSDGQAWELDSEDEEISIHAPHARSDLDFHSHAQKTAISIHAPHARSDMISASHGSREENFNPRSSCEERQQPFSRTAAGGNFNPRSSCEERHQSYYSFAANHIISIHAPHARSDNAQKNNYISESDFNPRSSCEERRRPAIGLVYVQNFNPRSSCEERHASRWRRVGRRAISIHAPHARSDIIDFQRYTDGNAFQSTLLMRGATFRCLHTS